MSAEDPSLDICGCCEGVKSLTPASVENRPGLSSLVYRVGTHGSFKASMQSALSGQGPLLGLTTRDDDDPSIALLDAWATVLDVLTFYQERIANEGYLRTATERRSILEMARSIGYELGPGVAAGTYLAFTLEEAPGSGLEATIGIGTKAQSIPGQDELPQIFETVEEIEAKVEWNALKPRMTQPQEVLETMGSIILLGTTTNLKPGDIVMILIDTIKTPKKVLNVTIDDDAKTTRIDFEDPLLSPSSYERPASLPEGSLDDLEDEEELTERAVQIIIAKTWKEEVLSALFKIKHWSAEELVTNIAEQIASNRLNADTGVFAFRKLAFVFGYNAPKQVTCDASSGDINPPANWVEWNLSEENGEVYLDNAYDEILPNSYAVIKKPNESIESAVVFLITDVNIHSRTAYGLSSKTTLLLLLPITQWWDSDPSGTDLLSNIRDITIYTQSEQLETAEIPIEDLVEGDTITLDGAYLSLTAGQKVILTGEREDLKGVNASEIKMLKEVILEAGFTVITFDEALNYNYVRDTVIINANVARATHGETKTEVLGSGDGSQAFQEFVLKQKPLTYVSAATPSGTETTLGIRVNDVLWEEVPTLYKALPEDRVYITRIADDGKVTVQFGDGITGARLLSGVENVVATYRVGTGLDGLVDAEQISMLMARPLGVKEVINPLAPTGADGPEKRELARQNAPLTVLTLDRIVSVQDFEDFARAFAGIGKAQATLLWNGEQRLIHLTVAGVDGGTVDETSDLYKNLRDGIDAARHTDQQVQIESYELLTFDVEAKVLVNSDYIFEDVKEKMEVTLVEAFSFETRSLGQAVTASELLAIMQQVEGVVAVDFEKLNGVDAFEQPRLVARVARWDESNINIKPAELLVINPDGIQLTEMKE